MLTIIFALILSWAGLTGTDAGLITEPAPAYTDEVPILPEAAYFPPDMCVPVPVTEASDEAVSYLQGQGWAGVAGDGMEALYAPGC